MTNEVDAFVTTLLATPATRLTACRGWTAHELVAHLAAGAAEETALIEARVGGEPDRPTAPLEERELPYRALPDAELRDRLLHLSLRLTDALRALGDDRVPFTGRTMSAADFALHSRSECALHRWDLIGRDDVGWAFLANDVLTRHAITTLTAMRGLGESFDRRLAPLQASPGSARLRSDGHDDVIVTWGGGSRSVDVQPADQSRAEVQLDAAQRLLLLWGRREPSAPIDVDDGRDGRALVGALLG